MRPARISNGLRSLAKPSPGTALATCTIRAIVHVVKGYRIGCTTFSVTKKCASQDEDSLLGRDRDMTPIDVICDRSVRAGASDMNLWSPDPVMMSVRPRLSHSTPVSVGQRSVGCSWEVLERYSLGKQEGAKRCTSRARPLPLYWDGTPAHIEYPSHRMSFFVNISYFFPFVP